MILLTYPILIILLFNFKVSGLAHYCTSSNIDIKILQNLFYSWRILSPGDIGTKRAAYNIRLTIAPDINSTDSATDSLNRKMVLQLHPQHFTSGSELFSGIFRGSAFTGHVLSEPHSSVTALLNFTYFKTETEILPLDATIQRESGDVFYVESLHKFVTLRNRCQALMIMYRDSDVKSNYSSDHEGGRRRKRAVHTRGDTLPYPVKTCSLAVVTDYRFFSLMGRSITRVFAEIKYHLDALNTVFPDIDFDGNQFPDGIGFSLDPPIPMIWEDPSDSRNNDLEKHLNRPEEVLNKFALLTNFSHACLGVLFTSQSFPERTLGISYVANPKYRGNGLCSQDLNQLVNRNALVVSISLEGEPQPRKYTSLTLLHEIGHSFGAYHDEQVGDEEYDSCNPGSGFHFIMSETARKKASSKPTFSPCSVRAMGEVLKVRGPSCLTKTLAMSSKGICGDMIVGDGEQCDCGSYCTQKDPFHCCNWKINKNGTSLQCRLSPESSCSPQTSPCCFMNCTVKPNGTLCQKELACTEAAFCDGLTGECHSLRNKPDGKICSTDGKSPTMACKDGICTDFVCLAHAFFDCECGEDENYCRVCCKLNATASCQVASDFWWSPVSNFSRAIGFSCNSSQGMCNAAGKCVMVDYEFTEWGGKDGEDSSPKWIVVVIILVLVLIKCIVFAQFIIRKFKSMLRERHQAASADAEEETAEYVQASDLMIHTKIVPTRNVFPKILAPQPIHYQKTLSGHLQATNSQVEILAQIGIDPKTSFRKPGYLP